MWILVLQRMALEFVFDLVYFPIWWFTGGVKQALKFCYGLMQDANMFMAPGLWLKNMFVPMYGQTDWQGRLMSIFMRFINVIGRSIGLFIWFLVVLVLFGLWLAFPIFIVYMLLISLGL
ncbi:MAG TPA: hypothetical protein DEB09_01730 [Candidatus Magasanikbacteria bacterium]|nr:hypothetical protein [Candidatus Magasanikbacteria bacterium]